MILLVIVLQICLKKKKVKNFNKYITYSSRLFLKHLLRIWKDHSAEWSTKNKAHTNRYKSLNVELCLQKQKVWSLLLLLLIFLSVLSFSRTMANLYRDAYWSQKDLDSHISEAQKQATKCKMGCFSMDRMKYYNKQLCQRKEEGYRTSFIDLWGLMIEYLLNDGVWYIFYLESCFYLLFLFLLNREKICLPVQRRVKFSMSTNAQTFLLSIINQSVCQ